MMICKSGARGCTGCMSCQSDPTPLHICENCKTEIYAGDEFYDVCGIAYCLDCVSRETAEEE